MAMAPQQLGIGIDRRFTRPGVDPYDTVEWERRDSRIQNYKDGGDAFFQPDVEFPTTWSLNATNIVAQKYFRGTLGTPEREWSLRQVIDRVVDTIADWGTKDGYFVDEREAEAFRDELKYVLVHQRASFNSPVWFNIGVKGVPQQASACFILAVDDQMDAILNWYREEGTIFKGGSGAGINLSQDPLVARAPEGRRHRVGPGQLHARRRRVGRHDQVGRQDAPRRQDGHPRRRPPRHRRLRVVQGGRGAQGARAARRRLRHGPRRQGQPLDPVPEREQLGARHRRVHAGRRRRPRLGPEGGHDRRDGQDGAGPRPHAPDQPVGVGVRRPGHAVRHHDQPLAHGVEHRPHQREQPVLGVHAPRQLGVQPREHQPVALPGRRRQLRRRRVQAHRRGDVHRAGDPRRQRRLPDREDRRDQPDVPPARPRLRQPRRAADGRGHAVRLRRRSGVGGGDHRR